MDSALSSEENLIEDIYGKRDVESHKYDFGHLLVVGGSKVYSGSPALNSLAAYRSGVDLVTTASPERAADIIASFSPSLITYPLKGSFLGQKHLGALKKLKEKATAVVIGGGIGRKADTLETVIDFLESLEIPAVVDADAIHAVSNNKEVIKENFVLTPHTREFKVLTGEKAAENSDERGEKVKKFSRRLGCVILLKGNTDVISDGKEISKNEIGSPYLTTGGTGDTLAGIIGSLLARGVEPFEAARASAFINSRAGNLAEEKGEGLIPDDLIEKIPQVIKKHS